MTRLLLYSGDKSVSFFPGVQDSRLGHRPHVVDLAVDAAARFAKPDTNTDDIVDLAIANSFVMALWQAVWAVPGKLPVKSSFALLEAIEYRVERAVIREYPKFTCFLDLTPGHICDDLWAAIQEAYEVLPELDPSTCGQVLVDPFGRLVNAFFKPTGNGLVERSFEPFRNPRYTLVEPTIQPRLKSPRNLLKEVVAGSPRPIFR